jgi:ribonuclease P protein component
VARFPRRARLLKPADYERTFKNGRRETTACFVAVVAKSEAGPRLGLAVSRKQVARAVDRNRLKRQIRASFREISEKLPNCDFVVMAKPKVAESASTVVVADLRKLWDRVIQRWSASSSS